MQTSPAKRDGNEREDNHETNGVASIWMRFLFDSIRHVPCIPSQGTGNRGNKRAKHILEMSDVRSTASTASTASTTTAAAELGVADEPLYAVRHERRRDP